MIGFLLRLGISIVMLLVFILSLLFVFILFYKSSRDKNSKLLCIFFIDIIELWDFDYQEAIFKLNQIKANK